MSDLTYHSINLNANDVRHASVDEGFTGASAVTSRYKHEIKLQSASTQQVSQKFDSNYLQTAATVFEI
jgi:hypothetical protein